MKILKYIVALTFLAALAISCQKGLDPINPVAPGVDTAAPVITINYPLEGTMVRVPEAVATVRIKVDASDDIELKKVIVQVDGTEISSFSVFKDYRRVSLDTSYNSLIDGDHTLTIIATDMSDKSTTQTVNFKKVAPYSPLPGEVFYMPFDGDYVDLVNFIPATVVGAPGFAAGKNGQSYAGVADGYLTFPTAGLLGTEFSVAFWYKVNATPLRAGILSISSPGVGSPPEYSRNTGFRLARENNGNNQNLFVNFGVGDVEVWMNPFITVPGTEPWMHVAVSIAAGQATIYVNGQVAKEAVTTGPISFGGCSLLSIMSGKPNFDYWEHYSDQSNIDELRIFNKALTAEEVSHVYVLK